MSEFSKEELVGILLAAREALEEQLRNAIATREMSVDDGERFMRAWDRIRELVEAHEP